MKSLRLIFCFVLFFLVIPEWGFANKSTPREIQGTDVVSSKTVVVSLSANLKATVIVFVSARCPCSASHEVALRELFKEFSTQGIQFVAIHSNTDEPIEMTSEHFRKSEIPFPIIQDNDEKMANTWGALKTPHVFVVASTGELLYQGGVDDSHISKEAKKHYLREALLSIVAGKKPEVALTRSLGCLIKR
jgi:peroxiredoxin